MKEEENREMLHGTFESIDKECKANDSKDTILLLKIKSGREEGADI